MHVLYGLEQIWFLLAYLMGLSSYSSKILRALADSKHYGWFCAWFTSKNKVKGLQRTSSSNVAASFGSQPLFLFVSLCEVVNSSFALRANAIIPRILHFFGQIAP